MIKEKINFELRRSKRRSLSVEINDKAQIVVRAPRFLSESRINNFLREKFDWIQKKQKEASERKSKFKTKEFKDGEKFMYLGEFYDFLWSSDLKQKIKIEDGKFKISKKNQGNPREIVMKFYKKLARQKITERVQICSYLSDIKYKKIRINNAKKRWGSCSTRKGNLNFPWRLVMAPLSVIDYVVVHELCHILQPNHSRLFWREVEKIVPEYKKEKLWLKENGYLLNI